MVKETLVFKRNVNLRANMEEVKLELWEEIVGQLVRVEKSPDMISAYVYIPTLNKTAHLQYKPDTLEANIISKNFKKELIGSYIAIARTDIINQPLLIRWIGKDKKWMRAMK